MDCIYKECLLDDCVHAGECLGEQEAMERYQDILEERKLESLELEGEFAYELSFDEYMEITGIQSK